jgi:endonuclease/exonuclease/phosphatase family metal-dependent hydrolase
VPPSRSTLPVRSLLAAIIAAGLALTALAAPAAAARGDVDVMTRNLYLGSGLGGATGASSFQELVNEAGVILRNVDTNDFRIRSRLLAREIRRRSPHLIGLQEVALWRQGPCTRNPIPPGATEVRYDFLQLLLDRLNANGNRYRAAVVKDEFDFEVYVNEDGDESTSAPGCPFGSELNGRLTMRDVILVRRGVRTRNPRSGTFETLLQVRPAGVRIDITRGWTRIDAKVPGAPRVRLVNVHFEAFDNQPSNTTNQGTEVGNGEVRQAQARELVGRGGAARGKRVILLGDLNSDVFTPIREGDELAHRVVRRAGFVQRDTANPLSCCLESEILTADGGGSRSDFDHKVDHILTNSPRTVRLVRSSVFGRNPVDGFWPSDHAGIFSRLRVGRAAVRAQPVQPRFTG